VNLETQASAGTSVSEVRAGSIAPEARTGGTEPQIATGPAAFAERRLAQRVFECCHEAIEQATQLSSVPPAFLGALAANESGGRAAASRFEPAVYRHLVAVARGASPAFGSINAANLRAEASDLLPPTDAALHARYLTPAFAANHGASLAALPDDLLRQLACSWGYTQIMGYHMVGRPGTVRDLLEPNFHFRVAIQLLAEFAADYQLDLAHEFSEMFCCWNTGRPYGKTFDPDYVENGLRRMRLYRELASLVSAQAPKRAPQNPAPDAAGREASRG
jgi:hypothetical protein